ncbi:MAG: T9SS type A sorting domain-containing protein [Bacteroidetes bacterium]|nr:T9SS type A sorting domain-containing protein [Bacteroidota bacterium]
MKLLICTSLFVFLMATANAQTYFQNIYADSTFGEATMAVSPDAYYLIQNRTVNKLCKVDLNGNLLWAKQLNVGSNLVGLMSIIYHNNALIITGSYTTASYYNFVAKADTSGNILWTTELYYNDLNVNTRIIPVANGYLLCGHRDIVQSSIYTFDITLTKIDNNGNLAWAKAHHIGNNDLTCAAAVVAPNGDLIVAGNFGTRFNLNYDPMIAKFDSSGNVMWMKTFSDASNFLTEFTPTDLCATSDGNFAMTGYTKNINNNYDPHVTKFDGNGNFLWANRMYQIGWQEYGNSIICDSQNNIIVGGFYYLTDYGDYFASFDLAGNYSGAVVVAKTSRTQGQWFMDIYRSRGADLFERPGYGYAYSTFFDYAPSYTAQCLVTADYIGTLNCSSLSGTYPFTITPYTWSAVAIVALPQVQTNIVSATLAVTSSAITETQDDICTLVSVNDLQKLENKITVYPSPANEKIFIGGFNNASRLLVYDATGRLVIEKNIQPALSETEINVMELPGGIYSVSIIGTEQLLHKKFIKVR